MSIKTENFEIIGLTFRFMGEAVGYFEDHIIPSTPGLYRYMPYRSISHMRMFQQIQDSGSAHCTYEHEGSEVSFMVLECPQHGFLRLDMFSRTGKQAPPSRKTPFNIA